MRWPSSSLLAVVSSGPAASRGCARRRALGPTAASDAAAPAKAICGWCPPPRSTASAPIATAQTLRRGGPPYATATTAAALAALTRAAPVAGAARLRRRTTRGLAQLRLNQYPEAQAHVRALVARKPRGAISLNAALALGETAEAVGPTWATPSRSTSGSPTTSIWSQRTCCRGSARSALNAGDRKTAAQAYLRVYYEFALTDAATAAASQLRRCRIRSSSPAISRISVARRCCSARAATPRRARAFQELQKQASGDDRELVDLRVAECDFYLRRYEAARDGVRPYLERASRKAEARFFHLSALRELGQHDEYVAQTRALVADFPGRLLVRRSAQQSRHALHRDRRGRGGGAASSASCTRSFRPVRAPSARPGSTAGGATGTGDYATPRSRRSRVPPRRFRAPTIGRRISTGRRARTASSGTARRRARASASSTTTTATPTTAVWRAGASTATPGSARGRSAGRGVVAAGHEQRAAAADRGSHPAAARQRPLRRRRSAELRYAQRQWGTSPAIEATIAWAYHQKGELRRAITLMRRAYPQSLTAGGHLLPVEMRQVIFPLVYWDLIRKHANSYDLDPYMMAALIGAGVDLRSRRSSRSPMRGA